MEQPPTAPNSLPLSYPDELTGEVAGCRVQLQLDTRTAPWHKKLCGTLFLDGGEHAGTFSVHVGIENYPDQVAPGQELLLGREWKAVAVKPGERVRVCFALRLPRGVPLRPMRLRAVVRAGGRYSATLFAGIHVMPPLPFQRVAAVLDELTGVPVHSWSSVEQGEVRVAAMLEGWTGVPVHSWSSAERGAVVVARFMPLEEGPKPFDALQLELVRNNGVIYGTLTLDPLDRTFSDRLRLAAGATRDLFDELKLEILYPGANLYGELVIDPRERTLADRLKASVGAVRRFPFIFRSAYSDEARTFFERCLRPYLDSIRHLPIPAAVPPLNPACLPRPADDDVETEE